LVLNLMNLSKSLVLLILKFMWQLSEIFWKWCLLTIREEITTSNYHLLIYLVITLESILLMYELFETYIYFLKYIMTITYMLWFSFNRCQLFLPPVFYHLIGFSSVLVNLQYKYMIWVFLMAAYIKKILLVIFG
jgi:hypothetical protein